MLTPTSRTPQHLSFVGVQLQPFDLVQAAMALMVSETRDESESAAVGGQEPYHPHKDAVTG